MNKNRFKINIIDSSKSNISELKDDLVIINLNAAISKYDNYDKIIEVVKNNPNINKVNLCNLASLCIKLDINYSDYETLNLINNIISIIKKLNPNIKVLQENIDNHFETDCQPIKCMVHKDNINGIIFINSTIKKYLNSFGFTDSQFEQIFTNKIVLPDLLPIDIINKLPLKNKKTDDAYTLLKEIFD